MSKPVPNPTRLSRLPETEDTLGVGRMFRNARELPDEELPTLWWQLLTSQRLRAIRSRLFLRVALVVGLAFCMGGVVGAGVWPFWPRKKPVVVSPAAARSARSWESAACDLCASQACALRARPRRDQACHRARCRPAQACAHIGKTSGFCPRRHPERAHPAARAQRRTRSGASARTISHRRRAGAAGPGTEDVARRPRCPDRVGLACPACGTIPCWRADLRGNHAAHRGSARPRAPGRGAIALGPGSTRVAAQPGRATRRAWGAARCQRTLARSEAGLRPYLAGLSAFPLSPPRPATSRNVRCGGAPPRAADSATRMAPVPTSTCTCDISPAGDLPAQPPRS